MKADVVGFIGLGLIGGSIAKAIKKYYPDTKILALASRASTVEAAYKDGIIENSALIDISEFKACDIIFLCSPVQINIEYMKALKSVITDTCLITDVGSVKGDISKAADELGLTNQFIGGHPMTGSEQIGYEHSKEQLLENAYYILTSDSSFDRTWLSEFGTYISSLGSVTMEMGPDEHDYATAAISHLPHVVASSLVNLIKDNDNENQNCKTIAAGGFKDITRIASSSPVMWQHICLSNRTEIVKLLDMYMSELKNFRDAIDTADDAKIKDLFQSAKDYRDSLTIPVAKPGVNIYELYLYVEDKPGTILAALTLLFIADISIKNIDIIHNREFEPGVLRIEFYHEDALNKALDIYERNYYDVKIRKE